MNLIISTYEESIEAPAQDREHRHKPQTTYAPPAADAVDAARGHTAGGEAADGALHGWLAGWFGWLAGWLAGLLVVVWCSSRTAFVVRRSMRLLERSSPPAWPRSIEDEGTSLCALMMMRGRRCE
jgi:hypothetical protein